MNFNAAPSVAFSAARPPLQLMPRETARSFCLNEGFRAWSKLQSEGNGVETNSGQNNKLEQDICIHIFSVSSAMVGVCLTVIGLIRVVITLGKADTLTDDFLAADALLFLLSCLTSYWALRSRGLGRMHRLERVADTIFIVAMIGMVLICALIAYSVALS
jgi:hypothetical protein